MRTIRMGYEPFMHKKQRSSPNTAPRIPRFESSELVGWCVICNAVVGLG